MTAAVSLNAPKQCYIIIPLLEKARWTDGGQTDGQIDRLTDRWTDKWTDGWINRQTDKKTHLQRCEDASEDLVTVWSPGGSIA